MKNLKKGILVFCMAFVTLLTWSQNWDLVWSDEFEGDALDESLWSYQLGTGSSEGLTDWGNSELQFYRKENAVVAGGMLTITAKKERFEGKEFTSARIRTKDKGDWTYCRIEFRAKMPAGKGLWAASWMMPTDNEYGGWASSGEIDFIEYLGHEMQKVHGTLHFGGGWPDNKSRGTSYSLAAGNFSEEFHEFAMEWEEGEIRWYVDDELFQVLNEGDWWSDGGSFPAPFDKDFHFLFNLAVGGNWPGSPDANTVFPQEFVIDYLRVYKKNTTGIDNGKQDKGSTYSLDQNIPNPFGPQTSISFTLPFPEHVMLEVFDVLGRRVHTLVDAVKDPGTHRVELFGTQFSPGLYSYRLTAGPYSQIRQMILL